MYIIYDSNFYRFDFKLSRKVDFKIHNFDPTKKRNVVEEKNVQKRVKGSSTAQGKHFALCMLVLPFGVNR